ncbi:hypothetical protein AB0L82_42530 [Nocardia sp. NPDC052001]|uniref:hypothetical protein n=1 Tax=Nocardia sp. NPDC052001 TaxID=3154853 RepID=UPI003436C208
MTRYMWFGYARLELLADAPGAVAHAIREYAADAGFSDGTVIFEPIAAEVLLREMLSEIDRGNPAAPLLRQLEHVAQSWNVDLARLFNPWPRADTLWHILDALDDSVQTHLIVPSRDHLMSLGPSGRALLAQFARAGTAIHYLDAPHPTEPLARTDAQVHVLVESRIGAIPAVAQLDAATELFRLGRIAAIQSVDMIYAALINDAIRPATPEAESAVIRLLGTPSGRLVIELEEPHPRDDEVATRLTTLCESTHRFIDGGRTFTRCTLPLETSAPDVMT